MADPNEAPFIRTQRIDRANPECAESAAIVALNALVGTEPHCPANILAYGQDGRIGETFTLRDTIEDEWGLGKGNAVRKEDKGREHSVLAAKRT